MMCLDLMEFLYRVMEEKRIETPIKSNLMDMDFAIYRANEK